MRYALLSFTLIVTLAVLPEPARAAVTLRWDAPTTNADNTPLTDFSHHRLKVGTGARGPYPAVHQVAGTTFTFAELQPGTYFAIVTAVDTAGNESTPSNELRFSVGAGEIDSDGDGLSDSAELILGTNPNRADTDGDGVTDGQEALVDSTNPLDAGSHLPVHEARICAPWNGFLVDARGQSMWNIFEHLNVGGQTLGVTTEVRNTSGSVEDILNFNLASGIQHDLLIHDSSARKQNTYGNVCSQSDGPVGDLRGTMVYYKPSVAGPTFDFAFAIAAVPARVGNQFMGINTYQPSLAAGDAENGLSDWAQITNDTTQIQTGALRFWRSDGVLVKQTELTVQPQARIDVSLHSVGPNFVGVAEWIPTDKTAEFKIDSARYFYDNAQLTNSFESAFLLPGQVGSGELLGSPYDTRTGTAVLEFSNVLAIAQSAAVIVYSASGTELLNRQVSIAAKSTFHLILDSLAPNQRGLVTLHGSSANALIATTMQYNRRPDGSVYYLYGIPLVPALGLELTGSYNTYVGHKAELVVVNLTGSNASVSVSMTRSSGEKIIDSEPLPVAGHGLAVVTLNAREQADQYGIVSVQTPVRHGAAAWVFRERPQEYLIPLQLTE